MANMTVKTMDLPVIDKNEFSSVTEFYAGKSVFVTGCTGFLGKLLVEKLLWSCPGIEKIYVLIRSIKNESTESRLTTMLNTPVFDRLRKTRPHDLRKISPICGDLSKPFLGISKADETTLMNKVSVVFHSAATTRFTEPLKKAILVNTISTKYLVEFCLRITNIKTFVYVSTAFSNCYRHEIQEEIYSLPDDPDSIISRVEASKDSDETLEAKFLETWPNTYTFSKAVAENLLQKYCTKVPIAVVRPSIILSSMEEPVPGWSDSFFGATPIVIGITSGIIHGLLGYGEMVSDCVPVDYVVNLTICAAWRSSTTATLEIQVYNACSGGRNPLTWAEFMEYCVLSARRNLPEEIFSYPQFSWQSNRALRMLQMFFLEQVPAYATDFINHLSGKKSSVMKYHKKIIDTEITIEYFLSHEWKFSDENTQHLMELLSDDDRRLFPFNVRDITWPTFFEAYCQGIRENFMKDGIDSLVTSNRRSKL